MNLGILLIYLRRFFTTGIEETKLIEIIDKMIDYSEQVVATQSQTLDLKQKALSSFEEFKANINLTYKTKGAIVWKKNIN